MPERCASSCSTVTPSPTSGRSGPRTERAVVVSRSVPSSTRLTTLRAVRPFVPLASANRVSAAFGMSQPRSASPYAFTISTVSPRSTRTTPEKPASEAIRSSSRSPIDIDRKVSADPRRASHGGGPPRLVLVSEPDELGVERAHPELALGLRLVQLAGADRHVAADDDRTLARLDDHL